MSFKSRRVADRRDPHTSLSTNDELSCSKSEELSLPYIQRTYFLANGYIRKFQGRHEHSIVPEELVQIILDFYFSVQGEWLNHNITLQIVNPPKYADRVYLMGGRMKNFSSCPFDVAGRSVLNVPFLFKHNRSAIWRMYECPKSGGFVIRPADICEAEDKENHYFLGHNQRPRWWEEETTLRPLCDAIHFQLTQLDCFEDDEYLFQRVDDGRYLRLNVNRARRGLRWTMSFEKGQSKGTVFRLKRYHHRLEHWRQSLCAGDIVLFRKQCDLQRPWRWRDGVIVDRKQSRFGTEIKVQFDLQYGGYFEGETRWIPIESDCLCQRLRHCDDTNRDQNVSIQIVDDRMKNTLYLNGCFDLTVNVSPHFQSTSNHSTIWRMHTSADNTFTLRPMDTTTAFLGRRESDKATLCHDAVALKLVQSNECGDDEYYIQSVDDGHYLTVNIKSIAWSGHSQFSSIHFQETQSEAAIFRFKEYDGPLARWRERLETGSNILFNLSSGGDGSEWVNGRVTGTNQLRFNKQVKVEYVDDTLRQTSWVFVESDRILFQFDDEEEDEEEDEWMDYEEKWESEMNRFDEMTTSRKKSKDRGEKRMRWKYGKQRYIERRADKQITMKMRKQIQARPFPAKQQ